MPSAATAVIRGSAMREQRAEGDEDDDAGGDDADALAGGRRGLVACSMAWPPISTSQPGARAAFREMTCSHIGLGDLLGLLGRSDGGVGRLAVPADLGGARGAVRAAHRRRPTAAGDLRAWR